MYTRTLTVSLTLANTFIIAEQGMLTEFEMRHIEAFPSMLRLLLTRGLIADLKVCSV